jgi:hypothetical protein
MKKVRSNRKAEGFDATSAEEEILPWSCQVPLGESCKGEKFEIDLRLGVLAESSRRVSGRRSRH